MTTPTIFGEFGSIEKNIITILAVAGGFFVGFLITQLVLGGISKFVLKHKTNQRLKRIGGLAGGVGLAVLVYMMLSGDGSFGLGGKGGGDKSRSQSAESKQKTSPNDVPKEVNVPEPSKAKLTELDEQVLIHLLTRGHNETKVFQMGDDPNPIDLDEVLRRIDQRKKEGLKPVKLVHIVAYDDGYSIYYASKLRKSLRDREIECLPPRIAKAPSGSN